MSNTLFIIILGGFLMSHTYTLFIIILGEFNVCKAVLTKTHSGTGIHNRALHLTE